MYVKVCICVRGYMCVRVASTCVGGCVFKCVYHLKGNNSNRKTFSMILYFRAKTVLSIWLVLYL